MPFVSYNDLSLKQFNFKFTQLSHSRTNFLPVWTLCQARLETVICQVKTGTVPLFNQLVRFSNRSCGSYKTQLNWFVPSLTTLFTSTAVPHGTNTWQQPGLSRGFADTFTQIWEGQIDTKIDTHTPVFIELLPQLKIIES